MSERIPSTHIGSLHQPQAARSLGGPSVFLHKVPPVLTHVPASQILLILVSHCLHLGEAFLWVGLFMRVCWCVCTCVCGWVGGPKHFVLGDRVSSWPGTCRSLDWLADLPKGLPCICLSQPSMSGFCDPAEMAQHPQTTEREIETDAKDFTESHPSDGLPLTLMPQRLSGLAKWVREWTPP